MFMFAFDVNLMSSKLVDLMLIIFIFLKIVVLVEMLKIKLNEMNNCRFYLFFMSALFFFQKILFSQR
jgi:hypothetical protein